MITVEQTGNFYKTEGLLKYLSKWNFTRELDKYGAKGVELLAAATPKDTGETANLWSYRIRYEGETACIEWFNDNKVNGIPVVILLQYGHGTRNGGYVEGIDFINPALRPLFEEIANDAWKDVMNH